jgi:hypothetical protein
MRIFFFRQRQTFVRKQDCPVDRDGQSPVPTSKHHGAKYKLGGQVPGPAERVVVPGDSNADADAAIRADDFKDNIERRLVSFVSMENQSPQSIKL